jgi:dTDP-6-deoxy-L-talose 4-dehydrogenase (NAD+)
MKLLPISQVLNGLANEFVLHCNRGCSLSGKQFVFGDKKMEKTSVIVTGATGFVGRYVVRCLVDRGYNVIAIGRNLEKAKSFDWFESVKFICLDYHRQNLELDSYQKTSLVHLGWDGLPYYKSLFHFEENLPKNYEFIKDLISKGVEAALIVGTCFEYGMINGEISSDHPTSPSNSYAFAKDCLRKQLEFLKQQSDFSMKWARLFYVYGEGQSERSILSMLDKAIADGDEFFNMSAGEQLRDYLPVEKVAQKLVEIYECDIEGNFNVCSGEPVSMRRLVEKHIRNCGSSIKLNLGFYPYVDYEPMAFWGKK